MKRFLILYSNKHRTTKKKEPKERNKHTKYFYNMDCGLNEGSVLLKMAKKRVLSQNCGGDVQDLKIVK